jgi:hypothetical protein
VDEGARDACRLGHLVEGDEERIVLGEQALGGVGDEAASRVGIEARRSRSSSGRRGLGAQAEAPARVTGVMDSPGASGWWQAT